MSYTIAVCGKGGVGKTTMAGLLVKSLLDKGKRPVLAVDADPNTCLDAVLGVSVKSTIGGIREEAKEIAGKGMASGISKQELLQLKIEESIVETEHFDLIAMGRPEGPGCYCYANNVLKNTLSNLTIKYPYVVLDNEAGLENLSRRIIQQVDLMVLVSDSSKRGLETVERLHQLSREMGIQYKKLAIVVNRMRQSTPSVQAEELKAKTKADILLGLADDTELANFADEGRSLMELDSANPVLHEVSGFLNQVLF